MSQRVVLLARVSRGERQQDPENQLAPLRALAQRRSWTVVREVSLKVSAWDQGEAAKVRAQAVQSIERGEADILAVWALDRIVRGGVEEALRFLRNLEDHLGGEFFSLQEPFLCTATSDRQQRELLLSVLAWVAHWESQRKSERLKAKASAKRHRAENGGGRATWGRGKMPTSGDVEQICSLRAEGRSQRQIAALVGFSLGTVHNVLSRLPEPGGDDDGQSAFNAS